MRCLTGDWAKPPKVVFFGRFVYLFLCFFVSLSATLRETAGPICMKFSGKVWSDHMDDLITFWVNSSNRVGGSKVNLFVIKITASGIGHLVCTR